MKNKKRKKKRPWGSKPGALNHALLFCTKCNPIATDAARRIKLYKTSPNEN